MWSYRIASNMYVGLLGHSAVFRVFKNVFSCFYVLLTVCVVVLYQWHFIDLFSCIAASLFNKLTWLLLPPGGSVWAYVPQSNPCCPQLSHSEYTPFRVTYSWLLCANMISSIKPMAHDILKCHQSRTNDFVPYDMHKRFEDWSYNSIDMLMLGPSCSWGQAAGYQPRPQAGG